MVDRLNSTDVLLTGDNLDGELRATGAIGATDLVSLNGTETGNVPDAKKSDTAGETAYGVAMYSTSAAGDQITVARDGCEVRANATGTISPGNKLVANGDGSVKANDTANEALVGQARSSDAGGEVVALLNFGGDTGG